MSPTPSRRSKKAGSKNPLLQIPYVIVDIETTGLSPSHAGITEIAAVKLENGKISERFHSLVNPRMPIPPSITAFTGITNKMVADAPFIEEVLPKFFSFLGPHIMVAHNASFDSRFLNHAARETLALTIPNPILCTLRLARRVTPSLPSKSLDSLSSHYGISIQDRHRAGGDVDATATILSIQLEAIHEEGISSLEELFNWLEPKRIRPKTVILRQRLEAVPSQPGVYIFLDQQGKPIYIGKSKSLRNRVRSYFQDSRSGDPKIKKIHRFAVDIDLHLTGSDLEASLLESKMIKQFLPRYNVMQRNYRNYPFIKITVDESFPWIEVTREITADGSKYFGPYTSREQVEEAVRILGDIFQLRKCKGNWCRAQIATKSCTLGPAPIANNPGIYFQLGTCSGPCGGKISKEDYGEKVKQVVGFLERKDTSFLKDLICQREDASRKLKYELAGKIQNQVTRLTQLLKFQKLLSSAVHLNHCLILTPSSSKDAQQLFVICAGRLVLQREFTSTSQNDLHVIVEEASAIAPSPFDAIKKEEVDEIGIIAKWLRLNSTEGKVIPLTWDDQRGLSLPHRNNASGRGSRRRQASWARPPHFQPQ